LTDGIAAAMNKFNRRAEGSEDENAGE